MNGVSPACNRFLKKPHASCIITNLETKKLEIYKPHGEILGFSVANLTVVTVQR